MSYLSWIMARLTELEISSSAIKGPLTQLAGLEKSCLEVDLQYCLLERVVLADNLLDNVSVFQAGA